MSAPVVLMAEVPTAARVWAFSREDEADAQVAATAADAVTDDGTLIWELAEKRATDFGTAHATGPATVNAKALAEFKKGRDLIILHECADAEPIIDNIVTQMSIPLIQGTLKYAYSSDPLTATGYCTADATHDALSASDDCAKGWAEGWACVGLGLAPIALAVVATLGREVMRWRWFGTDRSA